ncbi:IMPACT family protein [Campylobacter sp. VicNov18]|uniref:IMPACT family protein n=1 Tax=Campylobacter bilis TaxID=2691918 RepID=UPI00130EAB52|nr:YigZ family protein [Campylobacter bilis]MPV63361.1 YigZ family protein [Campylobacter hepaticus]MBM0636860.1 YigZ family protein [Campylobacter bilis]MCC8277431.1 IMPACT family protein [Campylobacter bilis]MCC8299174.1 IMPACT family protein [Campylobacter bilis]MCC8300340.1 IMPACT family protein [Campylobacter bilis]
MQTVNQIFQTEIEIKKSNFLSFLCPFIEFQNLSQNLKKKHPKAVHFVYAYRTLNDFNQIIENKSDDGEPKGTSGMPTLNVLRAYELINVALITVRYFGGIKLGTGGLTRAYNEAANTVINHSTLLTFENKKNISLAIDFKILNRFEHFLKTHFLDFTKDFKDHKAIFHIKLNEKEKQEFEIFCKNFTLFEIEKL